MKRTATTSACKTTLRSPRAQNMLNDDLVCEHEAPKAMRIEPDHKECHSDLDAQPIKANDGNICRRRLGSEFLSRNKMGVMQFASPNGYAVDGTGR